MPRVRCVVATRKRRNKVRKQVQGFRGGRGRLFRTAVEALHRSWRYSFVGRKRKKRDFRRLWITRLNAAVRNEGMSYSQFMGALHRVNIQIDRKMLSEMAITDSASFKQLVELAKKNLVKS